MLSVALSLTPAEAGAAGRYPAPLFRGARTFLASLAQAAAARSPGRGDIGEAAAFFESAANFTIFMGTGAIFVNLAMLGSGNLGKVDDANESADVITHGLAVGQEIRMAANGRNGSKAVISGPMVFRWSGNKLPTSRVIGIDTLK